MITIAFHGVLPSGPANTSSGKRIPRIAFAGCIETRKPGNPFSGAHLSEPCKKLPVLLAQICLFHGIIVHQF